MKTESFKGDDFILHICKDRSNVQDRPYQVIIASKYVYPSFSREELKDVADFINEFVEKN